MEFAIPGFIANLCTPNALTTLLEYLMDFASAETRQVGLALIARELEKMPAGDRKNEVQKRLKIIEDGTGRDLLF